MIERVKISRGEEINLAKYTSKNLWMDTQDGRELGPHEYVERNFDVEMQSGWYVQDLFYKEDELWIRLWHSYKESQEYRYDQFIEWNVIHPEKRGLVIQPGRSSNPVSSLEDQEWKKAPNHFWKGH